MVRAVHREETLIYGNETYGPGPGMGCVTGSDETDTREMAASASQDGTQSLGPRSMIIWSA